MTEETTRAAVYSAYAGGDGERMDLSSNSASS